MSTWRIDPALELPPSRQLVEAVLDALASGSLAGGAQLPSVRGMAAEALVNHNTVARAYRDLEQMGVVAGENGRGVFVTLAGPRIARGLRRQRTLTEFEQALRSALRSGHPPETLLALVARHWRESA